MENRHYYASILSNKMAYLPFWKENIQRDSYFLERGANEWFYVDHKGEEHGLIKITKLSAFDKFIFFGGDLLVIALMIFLIVLSFSKSTMLITNYWIFYACAIGLSYILIFSMKKPKLANMFMFVVTIITALLILKNYGIMVLYNNLVILCAIYIIFTFCLTSLCIKNITVKDAEQNLYNPKANFFKLNKQDGILLIAYKSEKLSDQEVEKILEKQKKEYFREQKISKKHTKKKIKEKEIDDDEYYDEE